MCNVVHTVVEIYEYILHITVMFFSLFHIIRFLTQLNIIINTIKNNN